MSEQMLGVTWIAGSEGGIGKQISTHLRTDSTRLHLCDLFDPGIGASDDVTTFRHAANLSSIDGADSFAREAVALSGPPDTLVIAAGYVSSALVETVDDKELQAILSNNISLVICCLQAFFKTASLNNSRSRIVIIGSNAASEARPQQPIYAATKSAIRSIIGSVAAAWGRQGVSIVGIEPGTVIVPRNEDRIMRQYPHAPAAPDRPGGLLATPADIAEVTRFALRYADHLTGHTITVDGGSTVGRI